tara:strand:+ start:5007 stop:5540 length:534 start_codon:yes stop_codon:yes gene_type:complete
MAKLITEKRLENKADRTKTYIQTFIMVPSVLMGMVSLIVGYGGIIFTFMQDALTGLTLLDSTGLLFFGVLLGWGHARYQQHLFLTYPEHYAGHFQLLTPGARRKRRKKEPRHNVREYPKPHAAVHYGIYAAGAAALIASIVFPIATDRLNVYAAIFLPLAGYFNAKFLVWRRRMRQR